MTIKRTGYQYTDAESGITLDCWFPRDNQKIERSCLAKKAGLVRGDFVEIEIGYLVRKKKLQISTIVVEQSTRGQGVGRALVESAVSVSRSMGATEAFLEVMAYNAGAEKFYSALGFGKFSTKLSMQFIRPPLE